MSTAHTATPHSKNIVSRTLECVDLDYRVRSVRTGNVVAAFLNSHDAARYIKFLRGDEGPNGPLYEIETTNPNDFNHRLVQDEPCNSHDDLVKALQAVAATLHSHDPLKTTVLDALVKASAA